MTPMLGTHLVALLFAAATSKAAATKWFIFGRHHLHAVALQENTKQLKREVAEKWIEQVVDHIDPVNITEGTVWMQRYFEALYPEQQQQQQQKLRQQQQQQKLRQQQQVEPRPMFVYIGGEGELTMLDVTTGHFAVLLDTFAADGFALEHRFYGASKPFPEAGPLTLRWLTVEQALADLAFFIRAKRKERAEAQGVSPNAIPVVVFGCSYPGSLAAFARVKYPYLISGAVSSSSPVLAQEKFVAFDADVRKGLPLACREAATAAIDALHRRIKNGHIEDELRRFGCEDVASDTTNAKIAFIYSVVDAVAEAVQYNRPVVRPLVKDMCSFFGVGGEETENSTERQNEAGKEMAEGGLKGDTRAALSAAGDTEGTPITTGEIHVEETDSRKETAKSAEDSKRGRAKLEDKEEKLLDALAAHFKASLLRHGVTCKDVNILAPKDTDIKLDGSARSHLRLWMWQSCAQFGFWQVGYPGSMRPECIDVEFHLDVCNTLFPLPGGLLLNDQGIKETNLSWGGKSLTEAGAATNIHFTNGAKDPWRSLSVLNIPQELEDRQNLSAFVIPGASHCTDFYGPTDSDSEGLKKGREKIVEVIKGFIERHRMLQPAKQPKEQPEELVEHDLLRKLMRLAKQPNKNISSEL